MCKEGNRMVKGKQVGIAVLAIALAALLLFTACAPALPAEEKKVVKIGAILPLTGPAAAIMQYGFRNMVDYYKYFEEVGVPGLTLPPGVTIELVWGDDGYEAPRALSVYERMRQDVVYLEVASPVEDYAIKSRLERDGIAAMTLAADEVLMYPPGWFFAIFCTESERFAAVCD